jgi:hypothetical protein
MVLTIAIPVWCLWSRTLWTLTRYKLEKIRCNKTGWHKFFTISVVNAWNNLSASIVETPSLNSFKKKTNPRQIQIWKYLNWTIFRNYLNYTIAWHVWCFRTWKTCHGLIWCMIVKSMQLLWKEITSSHICIIVHDYYIS